MTGQAKSKGVRTIRLVRAWNLVQTRGDRCLDPFEAFSRFEVIVENELDNCANVQWS
jgi:hypothetical protein